MRVGFKHIFCSGNTCPDIHFWSSPISTQLRFPSYSSIKHQFVLVVEIGFCIGFVVESGLGVGGSLIVERLMDWSISFSAN